jgi:pimeloyl-ACP methyl ester carboxylesterase
MPQASDSPALLRCRQRPVVLFFCYEVRATEHYGCETGGPWTGEHAFALTDEAARAIALVDKSEEKVHLIGHSYGGGRRAIR